MPAHDYCFIEGAAPDHTPLLMLHGSSGSERDMVPLAGRLAPASMAVALRGTVPWEGGFAFFRRFEDRSIDERDLLARADLLAGDVVRIGMSYRFPRPPVAIGFSNGAIMAAALVMLYPRCLSGAVLLRPLSPFAVDPDTRLPSVPALLIDGDDDERRLRGDGARLAQRLARMGADVTHHLLPTGHGITEDDIGLTREWLKPLLGGQGQGG
ncbi:alpha/beta hydrolase [Bradyrhizobium sp. CCBAU 11386]|uniref:alpha/beta hydrolase n=1 Tax=Bradyrhizobium sp. CCBAU 11386 TaxID=1630837 RepID=UPI002302E878|nr:esterase [Bradyrhizobium sp. CCBAU 11386]